MYPKGFCLKKPTQSAVSQGFLRHIKKPNVYQQQQVDIAENELATRFTTRFTSNSKNKGTIALMFSNFSLHNAADAEATAAQARERFVIENFQQSVLLFFSLVNLVAS